MRVMGLDVGERRIGIALSDPSGVLATELTVLERRGLAADLDALQRLVQEQQVEKVVVGLPRSLDGQIHAQGKVVLAFCEHLKAKLNIPVETWDERFSSVAADRMLSEAGARREKRRQRQDATAAAFMLQGYLDSQRLRHQT